MQKAHSGKTVVFGYKNVFSDQPSGSSMREIGQTSRIKNLALVAILTFVVGVGAVLYFSHTIAEEDKALEAVSIGQSVLSKADHRAS